MMGRVSRPGISLVLTAVGVVVGAIGVVPAAAGIESPTRGVLVALHAGDQVAVRGTPIHCAVSTRLPRTIECGVGTVQHPSANSYGIAIADQAALMLRSTASGPIVVRREAQPKVTAAGFAPASGKPRTLTVTTNTVLTVAGSHVYCVVTTQKQQAVVLCGLTGATSGVFIPGTYIGAISARQAVLLKKLPGDTISTVISRKQP